jgi:hypothetical protein
MKTLLKLLALVAASVGLSFSAYASDWTGGTGNWSSNGNPGWNGTGVPNAVGAVANFPDATTTGNFIHQRRHSCDCGDDQLQRERQSLSLG